jgi:hypothetical protein
MVSCNINKDGDPSVGLVAGVRDELDAGRCKSSMGGFEVVDSQEEPDSASYLVADDAVLSGPVGASEEEAGLRSGRADNDPSLGSTIVRQCGRIFDELETEYINEERDRRVVLVDDDGDESDEHPAKRMRVVSGRTRCATRSGQTSDIARIAAGGERLGPRFGPASCSAIIATATEMTPPTTSLGRWNAIFIANR